MTSALGYVRFSLRNGFSDDPRPNARVEFPVVKEIGLERKLSTPVGDVAVSIRELGKQAGVKRAAEWSSVVFLSCDESQLSKKYNAFCVLVGQYRSPTIKQNIFAIAT